MAEAPQEEVAGRFFCHRCAVEIPRVLPEFQCPRCLGGFIEQLPEPELFSDPPMELAEHWSNPFEEIDEIFMNRYGPQTRRSQRARERAENRRGRYAGSVPTYLTTRLPRRRSRARRNVPIENFLQDFFVNLTGMGPLTDALGTNDPVFLVGNPGDYAWGREGLDAIITQLLNQMDGTGPPPLDKDKIKEIPVVGITEDQAHKNLQCSVCWETFKVSEPVRKLSCEHVYHENCIVPWLQLHGTCPICRKSLNDEEEGARNAAPMLSQVGARLSAFFGGSNDSSNSRASSTSSSSSATTSSLASTSSDSTTTSGSLRQSDEDMDHDLL